MNAAEPIYLDYNATAPIREEVIALIVEIMATVGNASSVHQAGRRARARIDKARQQVADMVGAPVKNVIFTSGGTESDNLALRGFGPRHLIVSGIEHGAILAPALLLDRDAAIVDVDQQGRVDLDALKAALAASDDPALVSLMLANNETGVIQPVAEVAEIAQAHDALLHCDAIQGAGKIAVDINELGADLLSLSAHKIRRPHRFGANGRRRPRDGPPFGHRERCWNRRLWRGRQAGVRRIGGIRQTGPAARYNGRPPGPDRASPQSGRR